MSRFAFQRAREDDHDLSAVSAPPSVPTWARVFGIIAPGVVLLFLIMMVGDMSGMGPGPARYIPTWVKAAGIVALVAVLLSFVAMLIGIGGGSRHHPSRTPSTRALLMPIPLRRLALTAHVVASVGWIGAVAAFLALTLAELTSQSVVMARGAFLALDVIAWFIIAPLALASLLTGLILALFTKWGLFRHYWILAKLQINVFATIVLLMYMQSLHALARIAAGTNMSSANLLALKSPDSLDHGSAALLVLLIAATLSVYKPQGMTRYGWRKQRERRLASVAGDSARAARLAPLTSSLDEAAAPTTLSG